MHIQPFSPSDLAQINAMQPVDWPDIKPIFQWYLDKSICYPISVIIADKLVGVGAAILFQNVAWLGHIIVHPEFRNNGIGSLITEHLLNCVQKKKIHSTYLIATDLGYSVYEKIGFKTETEYLFFQNLKTEITVTSAQFIAPYTSEYFSEIREIDRAVSGEDRFAMLEECLDTGFLYINNGNVEGYFLPDLREGLIIATTEPAGTALMQQRLGMKTNASFPVDNLAAISFMESQHFIPFKTAKRMYYGTKLGWHGNNIYNRISGNLG